MHAAKAAADAGRVSQEAFDELRQQFNAIQVRAVEAFGEKTLRDAFQSLNAEAYRPPMPEEFEKPKPMAHVPARTNAEPERLAWARTLVDGIRDQALAAGWTMESLYFCEGYECRPHVAGCGLVCYIGAAERIGEVARQSIEVIGPAPKEIQTRFYNPDVAQPWVRRIETIGSDSVRLCPCQCSGP